MLSLSLQLFKLQCLFVFVLCYNVGQIKKQIVQNCDFEAKFKFLMKIGERERVSEILMNRILSNNNIFSTDIIWDADGKTKECFKVYGEELNALGIDDPFPVEEKKD